MSFWNGVKRAFGFSHESEDEEEEYTSALPTYAVTTPPVPVMPPSAAAADAVEQTNATPAALPEATEPEAREEKTAISDTALPEDLFDAVIELFNAEQPEFVRKCLSTESQRAYLITSISDSLRRRVAEASSPAGSRTRNETLRRRVEALETEVKGTEKVRTENGKLRLSLERQKRALLDRINDLEAQVAKLHAEKDRFFSARRNPDDAEAIARGTERIALLEAEKADLTARLEKSEAALPDPATEARAEQLEKELARQTALREQLELKSRMSDEMLSELRNAAAKARQELEHVTAEREDATQLLAEQLEGFEKLKSRLEARVAELEEQLEAEHREEREARIARLAEENASLRHTIENNLYNQANSEMRLRNEIKDLTARLKEAEAAREQSGPSPQPEPEPVQEAPAPRRRGRPKKARIDADLDNTEWFAAAGGKKEDPDFGYHEPPRRPANDNEAQLSLF